ncbi:MAG: aldehyde dehydrogenase family protein [Actinomycetota bacterium]
MTTPTKGFYIDGAWAEPSEHHPYPVVDPATEQVVATLPLGTAADVDRAVAAARAAFDGWSQTSVDERADLLVRIIEGYRARSDEFAKLMTTEMGVPITFSREVQAPCGDGHLQATLDALRAHVFERPSDRGGSTLVDQPIGVCGLITPWNWPVNQVVVKVAPALAAGCTMVLKPSEESPLSADLFAEVLHEAGCPPGVFNLIHGEGPVVGSALSAHPDVDLVSFTGSTRAGIAVSRAAAETVKRVTLELGGKSPNLLFADADLDSAVRYSVENCFSNSGQSCDAPTRLLVERSVYDEVVDRAAAVAEATEVGDPTVEGDHLGPVVNRRQFDRIQELIEVGVGEDNRLVAGGPGRPEGLDRGFYIRPTVFADVTNDQRIAREEVFGPVLAILAFDDEEEAIRIANDSTYGLGAFVQTGDPERAARVARRLQAGNVSINGAAYDYDVPFGGVKQSGNGRENGALGLEEYLDTKAITG